MSSRLVWATQDTVSKKKKATKQTKHKFKTCLPLTFVLQLKLKEAKGTHTPQTVSVKVSRVSMVCLWLLSLTITSD